MFKLILILNTLTISLCVARGQENYITLQGKIESPNSDSLLITNNIIEKVIKLNDKGEFKSNLSLSTGYYYISDGSEATQCYLKQGDSLFITVDTEQFDETLQYSGKGEKENNYLAKKYLFKEAFIHLNNPMAQARLDEATFLNLVDSISTLQVNFLESYNTLSKDFVELERIMILSEKIGAWSNYAPLKRFLTKEKDFKVSEKFPNLNDYIKLDNRNYFLSMDYTMFLKDMLAQQFIHVRDTSKREDFVVLFIDYVDSMIPNQHNKEVLLMNNYFTLSKQTKKPHKFHSRLLTSIENEEYKAILQKEYISSYKLKAKDKSPDFEFVNGKDEIVRLSDFKGKIVYIDIWATWCQPCIHELPELNKLISNYKDDEIVFISVSKGDKRKNWERFVKAKEPLGIQLFSDSESDPFFSDYFVNSIPRFILIDKSGLIVDPNAKRPSNALLKEEIDVLLGE